MLDQDTSRFAPEVKALLVARGQGVPPLQWNLRPNRIAANTLDDIQNTKLLDCKVFANEAQVCSVRSLLYLWNGWPREAREQTRGAPELERFLIDAIVERQAGNVDPAKASLRQVGAHPIFKVLAIHALQCLNGNNPILVRLRQTVQQYQLWEPFLFVDVFQQALAGKFSEDEEMIIRSLQSAEFTLLFRHCYERATGAAMGRVAKAAAQSGKIDTQRTRELAEKHRAAQSKTVKQTPPREQTADSPEQTPRAPTPTPNAIMVTCPKCKSPAQLPVSARGQGHQCSSCGAKFLVPQASANGGPAAVDAAPVMPGSTPAAPNAMVGMIGMRCPKCHHAQAVPEASRGKAHQCNACGVAFTVPQKKAPASTT
ncbi:MAG: hypothetical protein ABII12_13855 [Planctomycetota bacterium]